MARDKVDGDEVKQDFTLYVAIPAVHKDHEPFLDKVKEALLEALDGYEYELYVGEVNDAGLSAFVDGLNRCIETMIKENYDYLWLIESDVVVPPDAFKRLHAHNVDVAAGAVPYHKIASVYENLMVAGRFLSAGSYRTVNLHRVDVVGKIVKGDVFAGTGCVLVKRKVFESGVRFVLKNELAGLDMLFWKAVKLRGFDVLVDGNVVCEDLG